MSDTLRPEAEKFAEIFDISYDKIKIGREFVTYRRNADSVGGWTEGIAGLSVPRTLVERTAKLNQYIEEQRIEELEAFQETIVSSDKHRSDVDQQAWAYARVHKLAQDRIAELEGSRE